MYYNNDGWREHNIQTMLCNPLAELSKYNVGNLDTLGNLRGHIPLQSDKDKPAEAEVKVDEDAAKRRDSLVQTLKDFHTRYYSANQMVLAVYTKSSLDEIEKLVEEVFSEIEDTKIEYQSFEKDVSPFGPEQLGKFVKIIPIQKGKTLNFAFRLPEHDADKYFKSGNYLSHLIGHESKGSILDVLSEEGLALELSSSWSNYEKYMSTFSIRIKLTKKGSSKENILKIVSTVGAYINMLRKEGPQEWVYEESKALSELDFKYVDTTGGSDKCLSISSNYMTYEEPEHVLYNPYEYRGFKPDVIKSIQDNLTAENLLIYYINDELKIDDSYLADPIYKTRYTNEAIREDMVQAFKTGDVSWSKLEKKIHLPEKNDFIPRNFDILPSSG